MPNLVLVSENVLHPKSSVGLAPGVVEFVPGAAL